MKSITITGTPVDLSVGPEYQILSEFIHPASKEKITLTLERWIAPKRELEGAEGFVNIQGKKMRCVLTIPRSDWDAIIALSSDSKNVVSHSR